jgi:low affinity Fe/Cu permease
MRTSRSTSRFTRFASAVSRGTGSPTAFLLAGLVVLAWLVSGPLFGFSDTWQLVINTGTTIVTFLMVFLIQNAQYRDSEALHVKLDELIRAMEGAHNALLDLEELDESELAKVRHDYHDLAKRAREELKRGVEDTGVGEMARREGKGGKKPR